MKKKRGSSHDGIGWSDALSIHWKRSGSAAALSFFATFSPSLSSSALPSSRVLPAERPCVVVLFFVPVSWWPIAV
jgi:hypothetical protein